MPAGWVRTSILGLLLILAAGAVADNRGDRQAFYVTGVVPNRGNSALLERFVHWLDRHARYPLHLHFIDSYDDLSDGLQRNPRALGWTCGVPFVLDHELDGQQLVAVPLLHGKPEYDSVIIARRDRPGSDLTDFDDTVFAYSDPLSNSGRVVPVWYLRQKGVEPEGFFRLLLHTGSHERSIRAVAAGLADVAAIDQYVWEVISRREPDAVARLREVQRIGPFPFTPIVAGSQVEPEALERLRKALLQMATDAEGRQILNALMLDGFVQRDPAFFSPLKDLLEITGIGRP